MQPIIPKGYDINQFPPALNATQTGVAEEIRANSSKVTTVEGQRKLILAILNKHSAFFVPHYGTNMLSGIMKNHFPAGHTVKEGGGAGNSLSIAQEIMEYKNPSAEQTGLNIGVITALLNSILQIPKIESGTSSNQASVNQQIMDAVFTLDVRPTRDSIIAIQQVPSGAKIASTGKVLFIGKQKLSTYIKTNLFNKGQYQYTNPVGNLLKQFMFKKPHREGFDVLPEAVLDYYQDAYKGTPKQFWSKNKS